MSACALGLATAREALDTPPHERGYLVAALANHMRECSDCRPKPECDCYPGGFTGDTYEGPQEDCPIHGKDESS